jgi:hypothetical protein
MAIGRPGGTLDDADAPASYWSGYVLPLVGANSVDGFGLGLGGELFQRAHRGDHGYRLKLTASTYETVTLGYTSQYAQLEVRGDGTWIARAGYQTWSDLPYAGAGGEAVATLWADGQEGGNTIRAPYAMLAAARPLGSTSWRGYTQLYLHPAWVGPAPGGLLDQQDPFGVGGGLYGDLGVGLELDTTDRWPLPDAGTRAELAARIGATAADGALEPLVGGYAEVIQWVPVLSRDRLVVGLRGQAEKTIGARPVWEQGVAGGRWRDELGFEQALSGYGRLRTRGDGLVTAAVEVRPHLFTWTLPWFTLDFYGSMFAEVGWLYEGWDPGPPLPSVGIGPEILYSCTTGPRSSGPSCRGAGAATNREALVARCRSWACP